MALEATAAARTATAIGKTLIASSLSSRLPAFLSSLARAGLTVACRFLNYQASSFEVEWKNSVTAGHLDACAFIRSHDSEYRSWLDGIKVSAS